jgi:hypothetical protein
MGARARNRIRGGGACGMSGAYADGPRCVNGLYASQRPSCPTPLTREPCRRPGHDQRPRPEHGPTLRGEGPRPAFTHQCSPKHHSRRSDRVERLPWASEPGLGPGNPRQCAASRAKTRESPPPTGSAGPGTGPRHRTRSVVLSAPAVTWESQRRRARQGGPGRAPIRRPNGAWPWTGSERVAATSGPRPSAGPWPAPGSAPAAPLPRRMGTRVGAEPRRPQRHSARGQALSAASFVAFAQSALKSSMPRSVSG